MPAGNTETLRFDLLGPLRVRRGAAEVALPSPYQGKLLALLLVRGGAPVDVPEIISLLWDGDIPPTAVNMVQRYVGIVRRRLEPGLSARSTGRWLHREPGGYRLRLEADSLDLLDFRRRIITARQRVDAGDHRAATDAFVAGLDLWRGRCGAGLGEAVQNHPAFVAIEQEYIVAVREAADAARAGGMPARLLPALRAAAFRHPLDEALQAALLLTLAADGKQAEAVQTYGRIRAGLADELGVDPGRELSVAFTAILRDEVASVARPVTVLPKAEPVRAVTGASPADPGWVLRPAQLPPDLRVFAGRATELRESATRLTEAATSPQILAFDGMPAIGKTALAIHLAHRFAADFPDGQLYADLRGFSRGARPAADPAQVLGHFLDALGWTGGAVPVGVDARAALFRSAVAGRKVLVVLDNARDVDQVGPLLPGSPGNAVIITSRRRMTELATKHGAHLRRLGAMTAGDARACLSARIGPHPVAAEPASADEIIARCSRHPLALAIAAVRAAADPEQPLSALAADLRRHHGTLEAFRLDEPADLREAFTSSYALLSAEASRTLRMLSSASGAVITVEATAALEGVSPAQAKRQLAELIRTGLLERCGWSGYRLHELVRAYAGGLDAEPGTPVRRSRQIAA